MDDEKIILNSIYNKIESLMKAINTDFIIDKFTSGTKLIKKHDKYPFDIVFLDIDMPGITGIDIAKKIRIKKSNVEIVFITNKDEMVYEAIKYTPFRFIRKTKFDVEIKEALLKFVSKINDQKIVYVFLTENGKKAIQVVDIIYIDVKSHKLFVHMKDEFFVANGTLKDVEQKISEYGFIRIHQSYLVNYRYINLIKQKEIVLDNDEVLPISRGRYETTKVELMRFSREI